MISENEITGASVDIFLEKAKYTFLIPLSEPVITYKPQLWWQKWLRKPKQVQSQETERSFTIYPCKAANMARIAGVALSLLEDVNTGIAPDKRIQLVNNQITNMLYTAVAGIQNNQHEPDPELIQFLRNNCDAIDLCRAAHYIVENENLAPLFQHFNLDKKESDNLKNKADKSNKADKIIHSVFASASKHYGWSLDFVKWGLSWDNFVLYLAVIPGYEEEEKVEEKIEVKDLWDIF